jgi:hypothetical protein
MKSNLSLLAGFIALFFIFSSCTKKIVGEGPVVTETRTTAAFEGLAASVDATVYFTQSADQSITLEAQQNILDEIETVVNNNVLRIRYKHPNTSIRDSERVIIRVTGPVAKFLEQDGSGSMEIEGPIDPTTAQFVVSGSGNILAEEVNTNKFEAIVSGSGRIIIDYGEANEEKVTISGSGQVDIQDMRVKDSEANISGSGSMKIFVTNNLKARISGSGTVYYRGNPTISTQISGSGAVVKL